MPEAIGEATRAGYIFKFFAGECVRLAGELLPSVRPGIGVEVTREPIGVVALITPWNFPIAIPSWKIAPALAYGNCVVIKPADLVPGCAWAMAEIISRSRHPEGVFNLVMGRGTWSATRWPTSAGRCDQLHRVRGRRPGVREKAAVAQGKKVQLEMGGKNPQVILDDADLDIAVELSATVLTFRPASDVPRPRLIVTDSIHDRFVEALTQRHPRLALAAALDAATTSVRSSIESAAEQDLSYVTIGKNEGAKLILGGDAGSNAQRRASTWHRQLFTDTTDAMRINREEIFGPGRQRDPGQRL